MTEENQKGGASLPLALLRVVDLGIALRIEPLNKHPGCWEYQVDARWSFAMNGHREPLTIATGETVRPFTVYIKYNGWPAGVLDAGGGIIAAGGGANEDTFIAALELAIERAKAAPPNNREADEYERHASDLLNAADGCV